MKIYRFFPEGVDAEFEDIIAEMLAIDARFSPDHIPMDWLAAFTVWVVREIVKLRK